jgi:hypothetical protein
MYPTTLIDLETEFALRRAAPRIAVNSPFEAKSIVEALIAHSLPERMHIGLDEEPYYLVLLADIQDDLPESLTPKRAGSLCRVLGLVLRRQKEGFAVAWSQTQLEILSGYFKIERGGE